MDHGERLAWYSPSGMEEIIGNVTVAQNINWPIHSTPLKVIGALLALSANMVSVEFSAARTRVTLSLQWMLRQVVRQLWWLWEKQSSSSLCCLAFSAKNYESVWLFIDVLIMLNVFCGFELMAQLYSLLRLPEHSKRIWTELYRLHMQLLRNFIHSLRCTVSLLNIHANVRAIWRLFLNAFTCNGRQKRFSWG